MSRKDLIKTTASLTWPDGVVEPLGEFKRFSGGEARSGGKKSTDGAGKDERARGGKPTVDDITISREDDGTLDLKKVMSYRGRVHITVTRTPLDDTLNPRTSAAMTWTGLVKDVVLGEADTESEEDLDEFDLIVLCDGKVS